MPSLESEFKSEDYQTLAADVDAVLTAAEQICEVAKRHNIDTHEVDRYICDVRKVEAQSDALVSVIKTIVAAVASVIATLVGVYTL